MAQKTLYASYTQTLYFSKSQFLVKTTWVYRNRLAKTIEKIFFVKTAKHY